MQPCVILLVDIGGCGSGGDFCANTVVSTFRCVRPQACLKTIDKEKYEADYIGKKYKEEGRIPLKHLKRLKDVRNKKLKPSGDSEA